MLLSLNRITKTILSLSSSLFLCSCIVSKSDESNQHFLKQYGKNIEQINAQRDAMELSDQQPPNKTWRDPREIFNIENVESAKSALIDTSQIVMPKPPENFLPNSETLLQAQGSHLPEDMFVVSYNLQNFPDSYGRLKLSFDDITIPHRDAFGVETELGGKSYQLISNKTLQKDIDFTKQFISQEDRSISLDLIKEEKQSKRKKYLEQQSAKKTDSNKIEDKKTENMPNLIKNADEKVTAKTMDQPIVNEVIKK